MMIDTIIFDAEGVVIDTESIWDRGQEEFLGRRGLAYDRERIKPMLTGRSVLEGVIILQREYGFSGDPPALQEERINIVLDLFQHEVKFIEGFCAFFDRITDSYKNCIATALDDGLLDVAIRRLNLRDWFADRIFSIADVGFVSKPNPDLFLYAGRQLDSRPENCVVIEDSPHGVDAAHRAGMKCVGLATTYDPSLLSEADYVVSSYAEIAAQHWPIPNP